MSIYVRPVYILFFRPYLHTDTNLQQHQHSHDPHPRRQHTRHPSSLPRRPAQRSRNTRIHPRRPTERIHDPRAALVHRRDGLRAVRRRRAEHGHRVPQTRAARHLAAGRQLLAQTQVVHVAVGGAGGVGHGVGEAVGAAGGLEAGGRVERRVGDQAVAGQHHGGVARGEVGAAGGWLGEGGGEGGEVGRAGRDVGGAGVVEEGGGEVGGFGGFEEGLGGLGIVSWALGTGGQGTEEVYLEEEREWQAGLEFWSIEEAVEEVGTAPCGEVRADVVVEGAGEGGGLLGLGCAGGGGCGGCGAGCPGWRDGGCEAS